MLRLKPLIILLTFLLLTGKMVAQWNAFITNFKKDAFGRGAQTWQIRAYDKNHIFCANKNGVLQYNGDDWQLYPFSNGSDVRSVHVSEKQGRIYAGGENEFGYFEPDETGKLRYTQLSSSFYSQYQIYGGYWGVYEVDNLLYYVSDRHVVKQINDTFSVIESDFKIDCSSVVNGILYVGTANGIWMLVGNTWLPAPGGEIVLNKAIRAIVPFNKGFLAATAFDGLFWGDGNSMMHFSTGTEEFMNRNEIFSLAVKDNYIAVGTIHKGLLLIDTQNNTTRYYNDQNGLQNNTVLSICFDKKEGLWLGLDNGIDYISLHNSLTSLYKNPYSKGTGYSTLIRDGRMYLGTNRGLFYTDWPVSMGENALNPQLIPELSGQVWGLEKVGKEIFCLHDKGLYVINGSVITRIEDLRGALMCRPFENDPLLCWIGTYDGLFLIKKINGKWKVQHRVEGVTHWMKNSLFENDHTLWIHDENEGIIRVDLDKGTNHRIASSQFNETNGFDSIEEIRVHKIFGRMCFSTVTGIYVYDEEHNSIKKEDILSGCMTPGTAYSKLVSTDSTLFGLSPEMIEIISFDKEIPKKYSCFFFDPSQIDFIKGYESLTILNDSQAVIPNEFGFAFLDTDLSTSSRDKELFIKNVWISYPKDSLIYTDNILNLKTEPTITFKQNSLRFEYAVRSFGQSDPVTYRYRLLPDTMWSDATSSTTKEYSNLYEGDYTFEVMTVSRDDRHDVKTFNFSILAPWYRSAYIRAFYLILIIVFVYLIYILEEKRITRKRKVALAQKEKEMFLKEQEYIKEQLHREQEIVELKNEKLEQELTFKSQEMANLMINFTRKNEILRDIKQELFKISSELKGENAIKAKRMLLTLNNSIDSNIASDDALKRFEEQFNLVHNNFMKKVRDKHPDLNTSEIKMCAFVRMGLSSKEIAPLLNISVRGVETLRYRLRKKMEIDREASLTEYLNSFT